MVTRNDVNYFESKSKLLQRLNQSALVDLLVGPGHQNCKMMHANKSRKMKHQLPKIPQLLKSKETHKKHSIVFNLISTGYPTQNGLLEVIVSADLLKMVALLWCSNVLHILRYNVF